MNLDDLLEEFKDEKKTRKTVGGGAVKTAIQSG